MVYSLWNKIPKEIKELIEHRVAAIIIQEFAFKLFYKRYGIKWKNIINYYDESYLTIEELDYYCYMNNIMDPWYDYCDEPRYIYIKSY